MSNHEVLRWYLHVDLDAFFASVEQLDNPELRGKPVIVGGLPEDRRSVVSTASYEARVFGVHSAMPTFQAYRLCPQGIFVRGRMHRYAELSHQIMNIFRDYSPDVDQMSIDEAFIDLTGTEKLFGLPEETAKKIKARVKEETGLTVSIGLATTKYLAKIASGLSKPDGFYHIKHGEEQNFMLNLPLSKVWGLGPKSQELIRSKGLNSTRDIFEKDYDTLEFLFGKNMGSFLYNVVRGIEKDSFSRETKSHSISAETTFPFDLTDIYTIETELLELAHGVYFRLLKEESYSRTAFVKIRYDDFSTSSVQETVDRNIMTLDSFFEIIKRLFEKKYQNGRGIRLLGVGFDNIVKEEKPYQQDLFSDNKDEKKQAVEKAILSLSKKHPEIKVSKARTIKGIIAALFIATSFLQKTEAQKINFPENESPKELPSKDPPTIYEYDINDANHVDFELSGYWSGFFTQNLDFTFGNGTRPAFSLPTPVFSQDVELSARILLNKHWYFEADFADEFKKNTIAAGYNGNGLIRSFRMANRGITMPAIYSADYFGFGLSGGNNQAPGLSLSLKPASELWQADFLLRYDMTEVHSAVFYGMNSVNDYKKDISEFLYGREFRFPESKSQLLQEISAVYVEANGGKFTAGDGRKYNRLSSDQYTVIQHTARLILSSDAGGNKGNLGSDKAQQIPSIIVTFRSKTSANEIVMAEGRWEEPATFLGKIQRKLGGGKYNLSKYAYNQLTSINGETALIIQSPAGFSPFLCPNYYDLGNEKDTADSEVTVIFETSEKTLPQFSAVTTNETYTSLYTDFFKDNHSFVQIINQDDLDSIYPFAELAPEIYLNLSNESNICLLTRIFTPQDQIRISKDAADGTVLVYKNGILMQGSSYNHSTGIVKLGETVSQSDKLTITWQEDSKDFSQGAITAGAGFKANFLPWLTGDIALTGRWPLNFNKNYIANGTDGIKNGFVALSSGIEYSRDGLTLREKTALSVQKENTASGLVVLNQEIYVPKTFYLEAFAGKNAKADPGITGFCIPLVWNSINESQNLPAQTDIKLTGGNLLMNSSSIVVAVKADFHNLESESQQSLNSFLDVYLIAGIKAGETADSIEIENYPHWKLNTSEKLDLSNNNWQMITIELSDWDRSRLTAGNDIRLLIKKSEDTSLTQLTSGQHGGISGTLYFGPYEPVLKASSLKAPEEYLVTSRAEIYDAEKYAVHIKWKKDTSFSNSGFITDSNDEGNIISTEYFTPADFSSYKSLSWDFSTSTNLPFTLILDSQTSTSSDTALQLEIQKLPENIVSSSTGLLHNLKIDLKTKEVFIDGIKLSSYIYTLYINDKIIPSRQKLILKLSENQDLYRQGDFYNGRLTYSESEVYCNIQNYASVKYQKDGNLLSVNNFVLLKDFLIYADSTQSSGKLSSPDFSVNSNTGTSATISGIKTKVDLSLQKEKIKSAGHTLSTDSEIIPYLSAEEKYYFDITSREIRKEDNFSLDLSKLRIPVKTSHKTNTSDTLLHARQNSNTNFDFTWKNEKYTAGFNSDITLSQKLNKSFCLSEQNNISDYFSNWAKTSGIQFSTGMKDAVRRDSEMSAKIFGVIPVYQAEFKPQLEYILSGAYKKPGNSLFTDKEKLSLTLPFALNGNALSFEISRTGSATNNLSSQDFIYTDGSYLEDIKTIIRQQKEHKYFYTSIPFYEIFDTNLATLVTNDYSAFYELKYNRKLSNSLKDLYLPSAVSFTLIRDIKNQSSKKSDLYQMKAVVTNTSINNFGSHSKGKIFGWFEQEELFSTLTGIIKLPYENGILYDDIRYQFSAYLQLMLLIKEKTTITSSLDFSIDDSFSWSTNGLLVYERPCNNCLFYVLVDFLLPHFKGNVTAMKRKDTLNIELSQIDKESLQKYTYKHFAEITFQEHFSINGEIGASFTHKSDSADLLSLCLSLGAKAEF